MFLLCQVRHILVSEEPVSFAVAVLIGKQAAANTAFSLDAPLSSLQLWLPCSLLEQISCSHEWPRYCFSSGEAPNGWKLARTWSLLPPLLILQ